MPMMTLAFFMKYSLGELRFFQKFFVIPLIANFTPLIVFMQLVGNICFCLISYCCTTSVMIVIIAGIIAWKHDYLGVAPV